MTTSVYIGNDAVKILIGQVQSGKVSVKNAISIPLTEGAILNGVILNAGPIHKILDDTFSQYNIPRKGVHAIVDGTSINLRILKLPFMQSKKMIGVVANEFQDMNSSDSVIDYSVINPKNSEGSASILAALTQRDFLQSYVTLFREAKIELETIDIGPNCVMKLCRKIKSLANKTFTMMYLDKNTLIQTLFVRNELHVVRRNRMLSEPGTPDFDNELSKNINNMIQFNKSERTGSDITDVYLCGMPESIINKFPQYSESFGINVAEFPPFTNEIASATPFDASFWIYNLGSLYYLNTKKMKDVNFYSQFEDPSKKKDQKNTLILIIVGALVVAFAGGYTVLFTQEKSLDAEIDDLTASVNDPALSDKIKKANQMESDTAKINLRLTVYDTNSQTIDKLNSVKDEITPELLSTIKACESEGSTVDSLSYAGGVCTMTLSAPTEADAAGYVTRLRATKLFYEIDYTGYSKSESGVGFNINADFEKETEETGGAQ